MGFPGGYLRGAFSRPPPPRIYGAAAAAAGTAAAAVVEAGSLLVDQLARGHLDGNAISAAINAQPPVRAVHWSLERSLETVGWAVPGRSSLVVEPLGCRDVALDVGVRVGELGDSLLERGGGETRIEQAHHLRAMERGSGEGLGSGSSRLGEGNALVAIEVRFFPEEI